MGFKIFQIPGPINYLYDRESSSFTKIDDMDASALSGFLGNTAKTECEQRFAEQGLCLPSKLTNIEHPDIPILSQLVSHRLGEMVLQVTQNCNLRCDYCVYSGSYYNRTHTANRMSKETAFAAVDFFMEHSSDCDSVQIGFYGGEPLLEIELIQEVVRYVEKEYPGKRVSFNLTTNATLLAGVTADFMANKGIGVLVSLDGPPQYHNLQRRYVDGRGSYEDVLQNLFELKERYPEYFKRVRINTVVPAGRDVREIVNHFSQDQTLSETEFAMSMVSDVRSKKKIDFNDSFPIVMLEERTKVLLYALGYLQKESITVSFLRYLGDLSLIYKIVRYSGPLAETSHPGGPCTPGVRRLFVDVNGRFFPCERIGESNQMQIGSIESGFDENKIKSILNVGQLTEQHCKECWAFALCSQCIALSVDGETVSSAKRLSRCPSIQADIITKIRDLLFLQENGFSWEQFEGVIK